MATSKRPTLRLKNSESDAQVPDRVDLDVVDVLLPCRSFTVSYKVAELGKVSLTTEFLLRFLHAIDGIDEDDMRVFFGFNPREKAFVLSEAETNGYIERRNGCLWLSAVGRSLFKDGDGEPKIYEVVKRTTRVGFDLLSFAPERREFMDSFDFTLPQLDVRDFELVSHGANRVPGAFKRHYREICAGEGVNALTQRSLYSIDRVEPAERFSSVVRFVVYVSTARGSRPEPDLSPWRGGDDLDDRAPVVEAVGAYLDGLTVGRRPDDNQGHEVLLDIAPEFLKEFRRKDGLSVERFFREAASRAGEFRKDRRTVPLVGSMFTRDNAQRLFDAIEYAEGRSSEPTPAVCAWLIPQRRWGTTKALPLTLERIVGRFVSPDNEDFRTVALSAGEPSRQLSDAFDECVSIGVPAQIGQSIELFVIPGVVASAIVHAPIGKVSGYPVPLGILSFDEFVVSRVWDLVQGCGGQALRDVLPEIAEPQ